MRFPGIGPRQAKRFVYYLLTRDPSHLDELTRLIQELKREVHHCARCLRFFTGKERTLCETCADKNRDASMLMVVEKDVDFENVERSKNFDGLYFILGGSVPVLEKEPEKRIRSRELISRVEEDTKAGSLKELILALGATSEGDNTERYIIEMLTPLKEKYPFKISHLGRGLSTGTELEYSDSDTIRNALKNRS